MSLKVSQKRDRQLEIIHNSQWGLSGGTTGRRVLERGGWGLNWELSVGPIAGGQGRFYS